MSHEEPHPTLIDIDVIELPFDFDRKKAYREIFPAKETANGLAKQIFDAFSAMQNSTLANDMVCYAQNYAAVRLGMPPGANEREELDDTYSGAMSNIANKLCEAVGEENAILLMEAVQEMVDNSPAMLKIKNQSVARE